MISGQIDALRRAAQTYRDLGKHEAEQMMLDAADTIWQLRDDLQRANAENAKLREERDRLLMNASPTANELRRVRAAWEKDRAENAKLRTFLGGGSIVTDYWKDEDGTMHVLTTDGEHTYEYMRGGLADENAKLRELVRDFISAPCTTCDSWADGFRCWNYDGADCGLVARARELGVETDDA